MDEGEKEETVWAIEKGEVRVEGWWVVLGFGCIYGSKMVIIIERGVGVREAVQEVKEEGVDWWSVVG